MARLKKNAVTIKVYPGYGHTHNLIVYGHVLKSKAVTRRKYTNNILSNIIYLLKLFFVQPYPNAIVQLQWNNQLLQAKTEKDGFFKFGWKSDTEVAIGFHPVTVQIVTEDGESVAVGQSHIFVPHSTQYAVISDIDDTVLISHSASIWRRLREMFTKNPRSRKSFNDVVKHYQLLSTAQTTAGMPNPFFYVSSSEWNLYEDLSEFFKHNGFPPGIFLLNQLKRWFQLWKTGKTKHEGKLIRAARIIDAFPKQQFILLGDNTQSDPLIYTSIAEKYPQKVFAIYIRNVREQNTENTLKLLQRAADKGVFTCLFNSSREAISFSKKIGLIA